MATERPESSHFAGLGVSLGASTQRPDSHLRVLKAGPRGSVSGRRPRKVNTSELSSTFSMACSGKCKTGRGQGRCQRGRGWHAARGRKQCGLRSSQGQGLPGVAVLNPGHGEGWDMNPTVFTHHEISQRPEQGGGMGREFLLLPLPPLSPFPCHCAQLGDEHSLGFLVGTDNPQPHATLAKSSEPPKPGQTSWKKRQRQELMTEIGQRRHTEAEVTTEKEHSRPKSPSALSFQNLPHPLEPRSLASPGL